LKTKKIRSTGQVHAQLNPSFESTCSCMPWVDEDVNKLFILNNINWFQIMEKAEGKSASDLNLHTRKRGEHGLD